nr:hypothetical protein [uncultured Anaerosporobacter sp.]
MEDNFDEDFTEVKRKEKNKNRLRKLGSIIGITLLILFAGIIIYEFIWPHFVTPFAIKDLNENIELPYEFGVAASEYDIDEKWIDRRDEIRFFFNSDEGDVFGFSGFPDYSCSFKFTYYYTDNSKTSLFGFKVGDSLEKADEQLRKHKYKRTRIDSYYSIYERGRIEIYIYFKLSDNSYTTGEYIKNEEVIKYWIEISSTDKQHKGYYK